MRGAARRRALPSFVFCVKNPALVVRWAGLLSPSLIDEQQLATFVSLVLTSVVMAEKEEPKEGGLFAEESDYEDDSDEEEFKPGRGNLTKYDSTVGKDVAAVDLDAVRDNDEKM